MHKSPCYNILRHVQDINPYTQEPELESEIVGQVFCAPEKALIELSAQYPNDKLWFEEDTIWM